MGVVELVKKERIEWERKKSRSRSPGTPTFNCWSVKDKVENGSPRDGQRSRRKFRSTWGV